MKNIDNVIAKQREFFMSGATLPVSFRIKYMKKLYLAIEKNENKIAEALKKDLGKGAYESYMCEVGLALSELTHMIKRVKKYASEKRVPTPIVQFAAKSYTKPTPRGNVLIMSPWNYPFLLTIGPLTDALAAGNTAILKPSEYSPETSRALYELISECFPPEYVTVILGDKDVSAELVKKSFDLIFFTGSQNVGRSILRRAAEDLIPVVLELGGKSPCIVDESAKIRLAAKRIVSGKYLNCGQTCIAPDYILCARSVKDELISEIKKQIVLQYGEAPIEDEDYGRMVNERHFDRVCGLIDESKVVFGGERNREGLKIAPTVIDNVTWDDPIMGEEIFGPLLPVLTYDSFDEIFPLLCGKPKPLALYIFSENKKRVKAVTERIAYGGGCVNDVVLHLVSSEMGFGGIGDSGMGAYHGKAGFDTFSHTKSIIDKKTWFDMPLRYRPYKKGLIEWLIRTFLR